MSIVDDHASIAEALKQIVAERPTSDDTVHTVDLTVLSNSVGSDETDPVAVFGSDFGGCFFGEDLAREFSDPFYEAIQRARNTTEEERRNGWFVCHDDDRWGLYER